MKSVLIHTTQKYKTNKKVFLYYFSRETGNKHAMKSIQIKYFILYQFYTWTSKNCINGAAKLTFHSSMFVLLFVFFVYILFKDLRF